VSAEFGHIPFGKQQVAITGPFLSRFDSSISEKKIGTRPILVRDNANCLAGIMAGQQLAIVIQHVPRNNTRKRNRLPNNSPSRNCELRL